MVKSNVYFEESASNLALFAFAGVRSGSNSINSDYS